MRGLRHVAAALEAAGHHVVEWQGPLQYEITDKLTTDFWVADGGEGGSSLFSVHQFANSSRVVKKILAASGEPVYADIAAEFGIVPADPIKKLSVTELWAMHEKRAQHAEWWSDNRESTVRYSGTGRPIDGLIQ